MTDKPSIIVRADAMIDAASGAPTAETAMIKALRDVIVAVSEAIGTSDDYEDAMDMYDAIKDAHNIIHGAP